MERNFWNNNYNNIDAWMLDMYGKMTSADKKKKDVSCRRYYRWFNDGDFPMGLKGISSMGYDLNREVKSQHESISDAVEKDVRKMSTYLIKKYMSTESRVKMYRTNREQCKAQAITNCHKMDISTTIYYISKDNWLKKVNDNARVVAIIDELQNSITQNWIIQYTVNKRGEDIETVKKSFNRSYIWDTMMEHFDELDDTKKEEANNIRAKAEKLVDMIENLTKTYYNI